MEQSLSNITILCIEDEDVIARVYRRSLTLAGATMKMVTDGDEALKSLANDPIDLVLLDLEMPGTNGFDLLELHKEKKVFGGIPVIVLSNASALDDDEKVAWLWEAGVADIVMKCNMSLSGLVASISRVCRNHCNQE